MKRLLMLLVLVFSLFFIAVGCFVYFAQLDDYSDWITAQVKQSTGYDVHFNHFDNQWLSERRLSFSGVSVSLNEQPLLTIKQLELQVDRLDWWDRELLIKSVHLTGVSIKADRALRTLKPDTLARVAPSAASQTVTQPQPMWLKKLQFEEIIINDIDLTLQDSERYVLLQGGALAFKDLLLIDSDKAFQYPLAINLKADFKQLQVGDGQQQVTIDTLQLNTQANLLTRNATLNVQTQTVSLVLIDQSKQLIDSLQFKLQLESNKLQLSSFLINAFSGSLTMQADAALEINIFPEPMINLKEVVVQTLLLKDMQLKLWQLPEKSEVVADLGPSKPLPIESLFIKDVRIENIEISNNGNLEVRSFNSQIENFYLIKAARLLDLAAHTQQTGRFALSVEYLRWQERVVESFAIQGNLDKQDQGLQNIKNFFE